jgi:hypothetical protein
MKRLRSGWRPVMMTNVGVGQDENAAGQGIAREMAGHGVTRALQVKGGSVTVLHVNGAQLNSCTSWG